MLTNLLQFTSIIGGFALLTTACTTNRDHTHLNDTQSTAVPQVIFHAAKRKIVVPVEVAKTDTERAQGLMYRQQLDAQRGMLFVFPKQEIQQFWMKNTYIPLDIIFVNKQYKVVGIVQSAQPQNTTPLKVSAPSIFVVEVNAGFCQTHHIQAGTTVTIQGV